MEKSVSDDRIILNLGCGDKLLPNCINVDMPGGNWSGERPDVECDIRALTFADDYADEIQAIHVIEHFYRWDVGGMLKDWLRVLKPGGELVIECPCLEKIVALYSVPEISPRYTVLGLYGDPSYKEPAMVHKWCYSRRELHSMLKKVGFEHARPEPAKHHYPTRDMRFVAIKPAEPSRIVVPGAAS
jgi:predicted SAM-dependent methyltransferase